MNNKKSRRRTALKITLSVLILLAAASVAVGAVYARYRARVSSAGQINMEYGFSPDSIFLLADSKDENGEFTGRPHAEGASERYSQPEGWNMVASDGGVYQVNMILSNEKQIGRPAAYSQNAYIEVFATAGVSGSDDMIIQIETESGSYIATGTDVSEGSSVYEAYGPGRLYRFVNNSGEPISWTLEGGRSVMIPLKITAWGDFDVPGALTVIATGVPD